MTVWSMMIKMCFNGCLQITILQFTENLYALMHQYVMEKEIGETIKCYSQSEKKSVIKIS